MKKRGFTLIELMVAVALFSMVMMVSIGSLLSLANANRKAQALQSVMNNLNVALDGMVRALRMGTKYHCGRLGNYSSAQNCPSGDNFLVFENFYGDPNNPADQWIYWYNTSDQRMYKSENNGATGFPLTAPEVHIQNAKFYVVGAGNTDKIQPEVIIVLQGTAGADAKSQTSFSIESAAVQRVIDI